MLLSLLLLAAPIRSVPSPDTAHVIIVSTTDIHGRATAWDYALSQPFGGGLTRVATVVDSLRRQYPGEVVVVDAGDVIQGDPFAAYYARVRPRTPHPILDAMNRIGYDAATPGNHEFNFGLPTLRRALASARFPYVSGNIERLPSGRDAYPPFVVVRRHGIRIGIAGFTTPGVMIWDREHVRGRIRVAPVAARAPALLRRLHGVSDVAVVLIHSGMDESASYDTSGVGGENVAASLARMPVRPDLVVVGHSHKEMRDSVINGVHFVQPKNWAQSVSVAHLDLVRAGARWRVVGIRGDIVPLAHVAPEAALAARLQGAEDTVRAWAATPLGLATGPMRGTYGRAETTPLVNFVASVEREHAHADLASTAVFNPAAGFDSGPVTLAQVAGVYPYENTLRAIRISGDQLRRYLEQSARYFVTDGRGGVRLSDTIPGYNYDIVSGATYTIDLSRPAGSRITGLAVRGRIVAPTDSFTLAINNYRQGGGGGFDMLKGAPVVYDQAENIRDLLAEEIRRLGTLDPARYAEPGWRIAPDSMAAKVKALFAPGAGAPKQAAAAPSGPVMLRVLAISDLHGALLPRKTDWSKGRVVGGVAALKATADSAAAECRCPVLRVDAGDEMQGTLPSNLLFGRSTVAALDDFGLQAAAVGNHDFDWTVDTLRARMREARYPWLISNVVDSASGRRPEWAVPSAIVETGGLRVGVVGWITPETKTIVKASNVAGLLFPGDLGPLRAALAAVKAEHPDVTVLLAHSGAMCDSAACKGEILDVARALGPGAVDLIIAGHTHRRVVRTVAGVPILEPGNAGTTLGIADLVRTSQGLAARMTLRTVYDDAVRPDSTLTVWVTGWSQQSDSLARRTVATLADSLPRSENENHEYPLGDLIADAQRAAAHADVAIMNNGGIRASLPAGPVTYGQLFEAQPFQNGVVRISVTGAQLRSALEHAIEADGPHAHVSGITVRYDASRPAGARVLEVRRTGGRAVADGDRLTLAVNDFMAGGGSGFATLTPLPTAALGITDLDALIAYLRAQPQPVVPPAADRFTRAGP